MKALLQKLNINETFTKPIQKQRVFNSVTLNVPKIEDYNYMADLLELPLTKDGYHYLLCIVDLANGEFDCEPLKNKTPQDTLDGMMKIYKRKYLKLPHASIRTDPGNEFKGVFHKYLFEHDILHKVGIPNRHTQYANVESLNRQVSRLLNGYMNAIEERTDKQFNEWTKILPTLRKDYNKLRVQKMPTNVSDFPYPGSFPTKEPKFKVGDIVHYALDTPEDALGNKQPTANFRMGDYRLSRISRKIIKVVNLLTEPYYRYILEGIPNASYSEAQLKKSTNQASTFKVKAIIGKKTVRRIVYYKIWWKGSLKKDSTWEPENQLMEDGLTSLINKYNETN